MEFIKKFSFEYIIQILLIITFVMGIKAFVEKKRIQKTAFNKTRKKCYPNSNNIYFKQRLWSF